MEKHSSLTVEKHPVADVSGQVMLIDEEVKSENKDTKVTTLEYEDDCINRFLYGGPIGLTVNFILLIVLTVYFHITINSLLQDEFFREEVYDKLWYPSIFYFFTRTIPMDLAMAAIIVFLLYPASRVSRSTSYYWFIGILFSAAMLPVICIELEKMPVAWRFITVSAWIRYCAKVAAFLIECNWCEQVFEQSTMRSLAYYLFIPYLIYRPEYPRAPRIRWIKVISHIWWMYIALFPSMALMMYLFTRFGDDPLTMTFRDFITGYIEGVVLVVFFYITVVWLFIFANFNSLHGELLRFPHLKMFGDTKNLLKGTKFIAEFNLLASKWLIRYTFMPVMKITGSRMKALLFSCAVSWVMHEVAFFYITGTAVILRVILALMFIALNASIPMNNKFLVAVSFLVAFFGVTFYLVSFPVEYAAWNYSSMPCVHEFSKFRFMPLTFIQFYQNIWNKYFDSKIDFCSSA